MAIRLKCKNICPAENGGRGFVRILEAIIASLILLASLSFFFAASPEKTDNTIEQMRVEDVLASLQKSGLLRTFVKDSDNGVIELDKKLRELMPQAVDFSVEINGIPNPRIRIACVCTTGETNELMVMLSPMSFPYKERTITIEVQKTELENAAGTRADILFFPGKESMYDADVDEQEKIISAIAGFLENGTVFLFSGLTQSDAEDLKNAYSSLSGFMELGWDDSGTNFNKGEFYDTSDPKTVSYKIADYFAVLSGKPKTTDFDFVKNPQAALNKIKTDERTVIKSKGGGPNNAISLVKANETILENGKGRSVWFARYDAACPPSPPPPAPPVPCPADDVKKLFKATVLWASGEKYRMDSGFKTTPTAGSSSTYSYFDVLDGFEPFQIIITVWKIFE